ncbi:MAG: WhiB family transcriptional regulator [Actinomycetota bacterium]
MKEITFYLESGVSSESDWRQRANCRESTDPDLFFPIGSTGPALDQIERAKQVCKPCPVKRDCLEWALETHQECGVWGGFSEEERKSIAVSRRQYSLGR